MKGFGVLVKSFNIKSPIMNECKAYLKNKLSKSSLGSMAEPFLSNGMEISTVAIIVANNNQIVQSTKSEPGHRLERSIN